MSGIKSHPIMLLLAMLASLATFSWFVSRPLQNATSQLEDELKEKRTFITNTTTETALLEVFRPRVQLTRTFLDESRKAGPKQSEIVRTQGRITRAAVDAGLTLQQFDPQDPTTREILREHPITLVATGSFHQLADFLARLESFPENLWITHLDVQPSEEDREGKAKLQCEISLRVFAINSDNSD